jgi:monoamine oxidase
MISRPHRASEMECESPSGIEVLVVGCGLGGLFVAIELCRQGHSVKIIELKSKIEGLGELSP